MRKPSSNKASQSDNSVVDRLNNLEEQVGHMRQTLLVESVPWNVEIFTPDEQILASLSSHINAVKRSFLMHVPTARNQDREMVSLEDLRGLPATSRLNHLMNLYFDHMHAFFPCIDEDEFKEALSQFAKDRSISRTFYMLVCMILAVATYLDPRTHPTATTSCPPGWNYFLMAEKEFSSNVNTRLIQYYTVKAIYLIHIERLTPSYREIGTAVQLAFSLGLHDESTWTCSENQKSTRRSLWWTIYYLDRRIAQKCWKPYLIRENEVLVSPVDSEQYLYTAVHWARLWSIVWDSMFALGATKPLPMEQIEVLDAQILHAQRQVCESLQWSTFRSSDYIEPETHTRSRLVIFVVRVPLLCGGLQLTSAAFQSPAFADPSVMATAICV